MRYLPLHRKKRMKKNGRKVKGYTKLSKAIPVPDRPGVVNKRKEPGHWETDNMEGKRSDKTSVSVTVERVARKTRIGKLKDHKSRSKTDIFIRQLNQEKYTSSNLNLVKSITYNRDPKNAGYLEIQERLNTTSCVCTPHHS